MGRIGSLGGLQNKAGGVQSWQCGVVLVEGRVESTEDERQGE